MSMSADDFRRLTDGALSEPEWQAEIVDCARRFGWLVHFTPDWMQTAAMRDMGRRRRGDRPWPDAGWPDLALLHPERKVFVLIENKSAKGRLRPAQRAWIDGLRAAGVDARLARPGQRDEIFALLQGDAA